MCKIMIYTCLFYLLRAVDKLHEYTLETLLL